MYWIIIETHPKHFWSEARNLFVISTSLQKNRSEYFWLLHTQDSLIQSYEYLQLIKILMDKNNHKCIFFLSAWLSPDVHHYYWGLCVCRPNPIWPDMPRLPQWWSQPIARPWYPGICHQAWPIPPITQINAAQWRWIGIRVMADGDKTHMMGHLEHLENLSIILPFQRGLWILHCFFVCQVCRDLGIWGNAREFQDDLETFYKIDFVKKHSINFVTVSSLDKDSNPRQLQLSTHAFPGTFQEKPGIH